jgi:hypothetical protein
MYYVVYTSIYCVNQFVFLFVYYVIQVYIFVHLA